MKLADITHYKTLQETLECIENQLEKKKVYDAVQGNSGAPAYSKVTKKVEGYIHGEGTIDLIDKRKKVKSQMAEIERIVAGIPKTLYRTALEMMIYQNYKTWAEIGDTLQLDGENLRRNIANYLDKVDCEK